MMVKAHEKRLRPRPAAGLRRIAGFLISVFAVLPGTGRAAGSQGPVAWWSFDDIHGPVVPDDSGHGNDARIARAFLVPGVQGAALEFRDSGMFASAPHSPSLSPDRAVSVSAWIRPGRVHPARYATVLRKEDSYALRFGSEGRIGFLVWSHGHVLRLESRPRRWDPKRWAQVAGTFDGERLRLYIDGCAAAASPRVPAGQVDAAATPCFIGGQAGVRPFQGAVDSVQVFARALSPGEIAAAFARGRSALAHPAQPAFAPKPIGARALRAAFRKPPRAIRMIEPGYLWIDAEDFQDYGGWLLDTQFVHLMGSAYLIAAGIGRPVADARVSFTLSPEQAGEYHVWVRARNWLKGFAPGRFSVVVNGRACARVFGRSTPEKWVWEDGGEVALVAGRNRLALHDLTGYYGRCDALVFSRKPGYRPPDTVEAIARERARLTGFSLRPEDGGGYGVIVVGAGAAGCCAALAAARMGVETALIQDRPVLGGNASIDLGVGVNGAGSAHRNARETGIIEEVGRIKARYGYPKMSGPFLVVAAREKHLHVFLNQRVIAAETAPGGRITAVRAVNTLTNHIRRYRGRMFIDCTGDGWVGYYAGAKFRIGREARTEFHESLAPKKADKITMSGCLMGHALGYRARDMGRPVQYTPPPWAVKLPPGPALGRNPGNFAGGQWWLEHPGSFDDLWDAERARDELLRITFGYWDYIKNLWQYRERAADYALVRVPIMDARRESRRLMGDYILTENDVEAGRVFPDRISYGGWPLDVHHPLGILSGRAGPFYCDRRVPIYTIPFRILYSVNIENLLFAGRDVSVTHIALGSVRVQGTLATLGQAAGTAAALCLRYGTTPRGLYRRHIRELQQTLLRCDQSIPGIRNQDSADLARKAAVRASSTATYSMLLPGRGLSLARGGHPLNMPRAFMLPLSAGTPRVGAVFLRLHSDRDRPASLTLHLRVARSAEDFSAKRDVAVATAEVPPHSDGWVRFACSPPRGARFIWGWLPPTPGISWRLMHTVLPGACRAYGLGRPPKQWTAVPNQAYAVYTDPALRVPVHGPPESVIDGWARIIGSEPHMWISDPAQPLPQWIELRFSRPIRFTTVYLTFDTNLNTPFHSIPLVPQCVRDYGLACRIGDHGPWKRLAAVSGNFQRRRIHRFPAQTADRIRLTIDATNGAKSARVYEIRVYDEETGSRPAGNPPD